MLFERRPEKGLLGGMLGLPGTPWAEEMLGDVFTYERRASAKWKLRWRCDAHIHAFSSDA